MTPAEEDPRTAAERETHANLHARFEAFWSTPPGLRALTAVNHTTVGIRFVVTGFIFFLIGGVLALLMRTQLALPENDFLDHDTYNQLFSMHGTTMMFLFAVPIMEGFGVYLIPKMIGARDLPFPRLSAFGYWCFLFGGIFLYASFLVGAAPDSGWFMYTPLSSQPYSPGLNSDFWLLGVTFVEIASVAAGVELIVAILKTRAPGMAIQRMPLFAWYMLVVAFMIVFGFPPLILGSILLEIERAFGLPFFDAMRGGDPLLWQHLFWIFGHPEVYIIFLPAAGIISMVVPTFARVPIAAYTLVVLAAVGTGFISFGLWVHHMFTVGIPQLALSFFSAASMAVVIPSGIQVFAWIATLWGGTPVLKVPLLYILGFFFVFVLGGLTGVMVGMAPFDWQVHDTHFVVAHLHYVLIGGMVFPLLAGFYYWLPLVSGRLLSERLGRLGFWLIFIGFNVVFLPMHLTGLLGMPRRVYTYLDGLPGWEALNLTSTIGNYILALGILVFVIDAVLHFRHGRRAGTNPWLAGTLEWGVRTPVPSYNFVSVPEVHARDPLWEQKDLVRAIERGDFYLADPAAGRRETMGTSALSAEPEQVMRISHSTWQPLWAALTAAAFFGAFLLKAYWLAGVAVAIAAVLFLVWAWTTGDRHAPERIEAKRGLFLPTQSAHAHAPGWFGLAITLLADAALFSSLVFAYFFLWTVAPPWPPAGYGTGNLALAAVGLATILASSGAIAWAAAGNRRGDAGRLRLGLYAAIVLAAVFLGVLGFVFADIGSAKQHAYGAVIHALAGYQVVHLVIGMLIAGFTIARSHAGFVNERRPLDVRITALFWHYTVATWVVTFMVVHLFPLLA